MARRASHVVTSSTRSVHRRSRRKMVRSVGSGNQEKSEEKL